MSTNKVVLAVLALVVVGALGYILYMNMSNRNAAPSPSPQALMSEEPVPTPEAMEDKITVNLDQQNKSGVSGTATLFEEDGKLRVSLNIAGAPKGSVQPAHIHLGKCPKPGAIKYPLTSAKDGVSESTISASLKDIKEATQSMAINVHKSTKEVSVYVACGDILI
jgi:hypothetical protein